MIAACEMCVGSARSSKCSTTSDVVGYRRAFAGIRSIRLPSHTPRLRSGHVRGRREKPTRAMSLRYIGSKSRLASVLVDLIGPPKATQRLVDGFCGTGAVSLAALDAGWRRFLLNDALLSAGTMAFARLTSQRQAPFDGVDGYEEVIRYLNSLEPDPGFIAHTYSPLSLANCDVERKYFSEENASRIDAIRRSIEDLLAVGDVTEVEYRVLIADLLQATNAVANTAGTYGCFLRDWTSVALKPLRLKPRELLRLDTEVTLEIGDVNSLRTDPTDVVYLDPPYTKRQYAAYYHILESIAYGDAPEVSGVTGLRPWRHNASVFCYSRLAQDAVTDLLLRIAGSRVFMSYSSDGFVDLSELVGVLQAKGETARLCAIQEIGRYRPNRVAGEQAAVQEWLVAINREDVSG